MSSAYLYSLMFCGGSGMSDMYMLKSIGERTPPCGTPVLTCFCLVVVSWNLQYAFLPLM